MKRADFDNHPLWAVLDDAVAKTEIVRDEAVLGEVAALSEILFYVDHVQSFKRMATTSSMLFSGNMIAPVSTQFQGTVNSLTQRIANGPAYSQFVDNARQQAEDSLSLMAAWPRPYAKGQQVARLETLFDDLLQRQAIEIAKLTKSHDSLRQTIDTYKSDVASDASVVQSRLDGYGKEAALIANTVDQQKARIDEVVAAGLKATSEMTATNQAAYEDWQNEREAAFTTDFDSFRHEIEEKRDSAVDSLEELRSAEAQYLALSGEVAAGELSRHYADEAKTSRRFGVGLYIAGFVFLGFSALPLLLLLQVRSSEPEWTQIVVRLSVGVIGGSAATVLIRLGGRFFRNSTSSKTMELELRTIGPFLSSVRDHKAVDQARLDLISKTFGRGVDERTDEKEDVVPVTALTQVIDLLAKVVPK